MKLFNTLFILHLCWTVSVSAQDTYSFLESDLTGRQSILSDTLKAANPLDNFDPFHVLRNFTVGPDGQPMLGYTGHSRRVSMEEPIRLGLRQIFQENESVLRRLINSLGYHTEEEQDILNILVYIFAAITPLLGVGEQCREQSLAYIDRLIAPDAEAVWAHYMLDSTGKLPDGIIADTITMCDFLDFASHQECTEYPLLGMLLEKIVIPRGNTIALGSFPGCIAVEAIHTRPGQTWQQFRGQHCYFRLNYNPSNEQNKWLQQVASESDFLWQRNPTKPRVPSFPPVFNGNTSLEAIVPALKFTYLLLLSAQWGACIPSGCSMEEAVANYNILFEPFELGAAPIYCETAETQEEIADLNAASYIAIVIFSSIGACMVCGTLIEVYQNLSPLYKAMTKEEMAAYDSFLVTVLKCFSIYTNGRKVLNSNSGGGNSHLGCLSGIRVISMLWIVLGHTFFYMMSSQLQNPQYVAELFTGQNTSASWEIFFNAYPSVDTFFFLSGLLVAYLSFIEMEKKRFNLILFYVHRYIRLTVPLALVILFIVGLEGQLGHGPFWANQESEFISRCRDNWWTNLLYINNIVHYEAQCLLQTWYLACDMQFFWYSPILLIPMYKYQGSGWWGLKWWFFNLVVFTVIPIAFVIKYNLPPSTAIINEHAIQEGFVFASEFYMRPYTRFQPYLIGMALGFILFKLREKEVKMHWTTNLLGWFCALATGLGIVFGLHHIRTTSKVRVASYSMFESVMYLGFHRIAWPLALSWVVFACVKGYGGFINSFLSWGLFLSLARFTYMVYLLHVDVVTGFFYSLTYSIQYTPVMLSYFYVALVAISFGLAFVATLTMEAPFISLDKLILGRILGRISRRRKEPDIIEEALNPSEKAKEEIEVENSSEDEDDVVKENE